jgi:hypothetical protein
MVAKGFLNWGKKRKEGKKKEKEENKKKKILHYATAPDVS